MVETKKLTGTRNIDPNNNINPKKIASKILPIKFNA